MSKLLGEAAQRQQARLRKANVEADPADLDAQRSANDNASVSDSVSAGENDSGKTGEKDAGPVAAAVAAVKSDRPSVKKAAKKTAVSKSASRKSGGNAGENTGKKKERRVGRPPGPPRVPTTVRLLGDLDGPLTRACTDTGTGPQDILDVALAEWLIRHDYLDKKVLPFTVTTVMARVKQEQP